MTTQTDGGAGRGRPSRAGEDGPVPGMAELRDVTPPPALVAAVMRRVADPAAPGLWSWLTRPRRVELRLSPLAGLTAALAVAGVSLVAVVPLLPGAGVVRTAGSAVAPAAEAQAAQRDREKDMVLVRFVVEARGARRVALAGDFNGWNVDVNVLEDPDRDGLFAGTVSLPRGDHRYMFVVDGEWRTDPGADARLPDGFGRENAVLHL